ncbi:hypothetical protein HRTV-22_gp64 [Halorubrum virus HRTV-22]|nr:hypothetical protein HRTV-18_gp63 [Halorubrum virus HRTV-18]UBF19895.1 hypothetical protein HRTV-20_gp63 [Halorubrum virus HRTV-20]UBF20019.1 hypothetical protein HRTV-22_gp64 [Halorubrum virus HRTV-22]UBF20146.1 hypothetical protein HRTV-26_gp65 [Halorubrum virus HRTV-26]UFK26299.1 hypothetical protein [Hardygib1 virus]
MNEDEDQDLHDEIDALALEIERSIKIAKERNKKWEGVFDPQPRVMKNQAEALFS